MARTFTAHTTLAPEALQFHSLTGTEEMSRLFDFNLKLVSSDKSISLNAILGKSVTVEIEREDKSSRYLSGFVTEFSMEKRDGRLYVYQARVRPQLYFLSLTKDFRIYQKQTARDIVLGIFRQFGIATQDNTRGDYRNRDYTVQYGESYLDFAMRMMEAEGMAFYFKHEMGEHTLVLCDSISAYATLPSHATIPYYPPELAGIPDCEFIGEWFPRKEVHAGRYVSRDYDFKNPRANLDYIQPTQSQHANNQYEIYEYPGGYREMDHAQNYARIIADTLQSGHEQAEGDSDVRGIAPGYRFTMTDCPRTDQNREYLITAATYEFIDNSYEGAGAAKVTVHNTRFTVIPSGYTFRPERLTPQPNISGPDTAVVVGPAGEEIWTDSHGRVKVQFHWDRYGSKDADSSCWVRVSSPLAGSNFGMVTIPRIGQEVIIEYPNGNPDHPIITGRFYNADNMSPWGLPGNATQSGILSRSTKDGGYENANALRFEDKKGEESLWLHAEKDQLTEVENDEKKWVGRDRVKTIDRDETNHIQRDRTETVDRDETITVHGKRTEEVDGNETITIHSNRTETVDQNETITIHGSRSEVVDGQENITIHSGRDERVDQSETVSIGGSRDMDIGASESLSVSDSRKKSVGSNESDSIGKNWSIKVGKMKLENIGMAMMQNIGMAKSVNVGMVYSTIVGMMRVNMVGMMDKLTVGMSRDVSIGQTLDTLIGKKESRKIGDTRSTAVGNRDTLTVGGVQVTSVGSHLELSCGAAKIVLTAEGGIYLQGTHIEMQATAAINGDSPSVDINCGKSKAPPEAPPPADQQAAPSAAPPGGNGLVEGAGSGAGTDSLMSGLKDLASNAKSVFSTLNQLKSIAATAQAIKNGDLGAMAGVAGKLAGGSGKGSGGPSAGMPGSGLGDGSSGNF